MAEVLKSLKRYDFPEVLRPAIHQLEKSLTSKFEPSMELNEQIIDEFIFQQQPARKSSQRKKLTPLQELQVSETLLKHFDQKANPVLQQRLFKIIFASNDPIKIDLMYKFVSMAIGVGNSNVLNAAAVLIQAKGCGSDMVCNLSKRLVEDYFSLMSSSALSPMQKLPALSPHFACNFITALTCIYNPKGHKSGPILPDCLLERLATWLTEDPRLCLAALWCSHNPALSAARPNLWTSPTKSNTQTPTPGLVRWCVKAPLLHELTTLELNNKFGGGSGDNNSTAAAGKGAQAHTPDRQQELWSQLQLAVLEAMLQLRYIPDASQLELLALVDMNRAFCELMDLHLQHKQQELWSQLQLAVLEAMLQLRCIPDASQLELLTLVDMNRAVRELLDLHSQLKTTESSQHAQIGLDRLAQVLQISLATGAFRCSLMDLRRILQSLPTTPLVQLLERHHLSTAPPAMHNAPV